jgi:cyclic beta-1,2-glucan synthetase
VSAALTLLLLLGWTVLSSAWFWTLSVIGIILIPPLFASLLEMFQKPGDVLLGQHLTALRRSADRHFAQAAFAFVCLPYEAFFSLDAIIRTGVADTDYAQANARMESVGRWGAP